MRLMDHTGQRFGRLLVVERVLPNCGHNLRWHCQCDCGNEVTVLSCHLRSGHTRSCGCYRRDVSTAKATIHGHAAGGRPPHWLYPTWHGIKTRCDNPNSEPYHNYGGRGITMHEPWREDFARFLADILAELGERPPNPPGWAADRPCYSLDRIDNDGNYEPGNLRWATAKVQANNSRKARPDTQGAKIVDLYAQGLPAHAIGTLLGCSKPHVLKRLREAGVTIRPSWRKALALDISELRALRERGLTHQAIADRMGCSETTVRKRLLDGSPV